MSKLTITHVVFIAPRDTDNYSNLSVCQVRVLYRNKCIGDDMKAAARQSHNCIKNKQKIKYGEKRFSIWRMEFLHPAMWHDHDVDFVR